MKMRVSNDWLRSQIMKDPDVDLMAGFVPDETSTDPKATWMTPEEHTAAAQAYWDSKQAQRDETPGAVEDGGSDLATPEPTMPPEAMRDW